MFSWKANRTFENSFSFTSRGGKLEAFLYTSNCILNSFRFSSSIPGEPRLCVLHKGKKGFGFVLRGAKAASPLMEMIPSDKCPGLQYLDDVDPGGVADMAGVRKGDFVLEVTIENSQALFILTWPLFLQINQVDVTQASHETVVNLIRKSGDLVSLKVITIPALYNDFNNARVAAAAGGDIASVGGDSVGRGCSTLPRKFANRPLGVAQPPPPPKRDPTTTLSVGRAKARSMVANMQAIGT